MSQKPTQSQPALISLAEARPELESNKTKEEDEAKDRRDEEEDDNGGKFGEISVHNARQKYLRGAYREALAICEVIYEADAHRKDNLLMMGSIHYQLRNFSENIFYNQQAIRVDPSFAEAYGNLGNGLRELGDVKAAIEFYLKAIKLKPRYADAYNNLASAYMQLGRTKQALETYQMALVLNPGLVSAHTNIGNLYKAQGKLEEARKAYLEAIRIRPDFAIAWSNIAGLFKDEGELDTAIAYYEEAIRLAPTLADAHNNLGIALKESGRLRDAESAYHKAIQLRPDFAIAHGNLGNVYYDLGHLDKAIDCFRHSILLEPNFPDAHCNLGNALMDIGDYDAALTQFRTCIKMKPDHPHAYNNLGNLLKDRGLVKEAMHCYMTACRLMPRFAAAHSNLASALKEQGKLDQAIAHYQECISIDPNFAAAYCNLGTAYREMGRLTDAIKCFTKAIRLDDHLPIAYFNLGCAYRDAGRLDDAISCFRKAIKLKPEYADAKINLMHTLASICDWESRAKDAESFRVTLKRQLGIVDHTSNASPPLAIPTPSIQPFHTFAFSVAELGPEAGTLLLKLSESYATQVQRSLDMQSFPEFRYKAKMPDEKLRLGYVSANFGNTPLTFLFQGVFGAHDENEFSVYCYSTTDDDKSRLRRRVERESEHFKCISGLTGFEAAKAINSDGVHVLIDLDGFTSGSQFEIFAHRPAPIQISLLNNFCSPRCADFVQYTVIDKELAKAIDTRKNNSHKLVVMNRPFIVSDHKQSARFVLNTDDCPKRSKYGLEEDMFVFACFNQGYKIDPETFACWCKILERVPRAVLWLLNNPKLAQGNLKAEARARGIREERLIFADLEPRQMHLKRLYLADVFLDTPQCNGVSSTVDALWAGVPVLTWTRAELGGRMSNRVTASLLQDLGLNSLITSDLKEYEETAIALATNPDQTWELRRKVEQERLSCKLFNLNSWVSEFEEGVRKVWCLHEAGEQPEDINLP